VIGSSIQVLPEEHGYEKWSNFPAAREELLDAIVAHAGPNVLLLSGDRHLGEISRVEHGGRVLHEVTSSGLTHSYEAADEPNRHRISSLIGSRNFGLLHFVKDEGGPHLLAEVRAVTDGAVLADLALTSPSLNNNELADLIHQNQTVSKELKPCPNRPIKSANRWPILVRLPRRRTS